MASKRDFFDDVNKVYRQLDREGVLRPIEKLFSRALGWGKNRSELATKTLVCLLRANSQKWLKLGAITRNDLQELSGISSTSLKHLQTVGYLTQFQNKYKLSFDDFLLIINDMRRGETLPSQNITVTVRRIHSLVLGIVPWDYYPLFIHDRINEEAVCFTVVPTLLRAYEKIYLYTDTLYAAYPRAKNEWSASVKIYHKVFRELIEGREKEVHAAIDLHAIVEEVKKTTGDLMRMEETGRAEKYLDELAHLVTEEVILARHVHPFMGVSVMAVIDKRAEKGEILYMNEHLGQMRAIRLFDLESSKMRARWHEEIEKAQGPDDFLSELEDVRRRLKEL